MAEAIPSGMAGGVAASTRAATGLALTVALVAAIVGGVLFGVLAFLVRHSGTSRGRPECRPLGKRPRDGPLDHLLNT